jgi:hypothetical protein
MIGSLNMDGRSVNSDGLIVRGKIADRILEGDISGYLAESVGMEIAPLFRSLMVALPNAEDLSEKKIDRFEAVLHSFFNWEEEVMVLGTPTDQEREAHRDFVEGSLKVIRLMRKQDPKNEKLEMLEINFEDSEGMFHGLSKVEADKVLSVFENER